MVSRLPYDNECSWKFQGESVYSLLNGTFVFRNTDFKYSPSKQRYYEILKANLSYQINKHLLLNQVKQWGSVC